MNCREGRKKNPVRSPSASEAARLPQVTLNHKWLLVSSIAALSAASAVFAWRQNHLAVVGGPISVAKTLWLNYMLIAMYVVPFFQWREKTLAPATRGLFGWLFASFALRAPIELWVIFFTRGWRCGYGITHDLLTIGLLAFLRWRMSPDVARRDFSALRVANFLQITLFVEMFMAWEFSKLASPAEGIYFAADTPHFRIVNVASWIAVAIGYPALLYLLSRSREERAHVE
jgi:hypothetical protein